MDVKYEDEDKAITLSFSLPESWSHLLTSMWFSITYTIDYYIFVGSLLIEEINKWYLQ